MPPRSVALGVAEAVRVDATVAGLVGDRVSPQVIDPDAEAPYVTYQTISESPERVLTPGSLGAWETRVQFTAWADTYAEACDVADAVSDALDDQVGAYGAGTSGGVDGYDVQSIRIDNRIDIGGDPIDSGEETGRYGIVVDAVVRWCRPAA